MFDDFGKTSSGLYIRHAEQNKWLGKSGMDEKQLLKEYGHLPVCPKCERPAWRDKGWSEEKRIQCNHCGYSGISNTTVRQYIENQLYK